MIFFPRHHHESWILFVFFVFHSPSCLTAACSGDAQYVCGFHGEMVRLYSGMKWMLQSVSGFETWRAGEDLQTWLPVIPSETSPGSEHDWWRRQISVKLSMEPLLFFFVFFFTAMWFQFCLFPSDSAAVQSHPRRTLMVKLVKNMAN